MLSKKEIEYLENIIIDYKTKDSGCMRWDGYYGHYARMIRYRIRKKIKQMINDLLLLEKAEDLYCSSPKTNTPFYRNHAAEWDINHEKKLFHPICSITIKDERHIHGREDEDVIISLHIPSYAAEEFLKTKNDSTGAIKKMG